MPLLYDWIITDVIEREVNAANAKARAHQSTYKKQYPFTIRKAWADALNPASNTSDTTVLAQLLQDGAAKAGPDPMGDFAPALNFPSSVQAVILSKAVADGLSRIGAEYRVNPLVSSARNVTVCRNEWCSSGIFVNPPIGPGILNGTVANWNDYFEDFSYGDWPDDEQILHSFSEPENVDSVWTRVSFPVKRYGYAWSSNTVTVKVATAVLMLHVLVIGIHCCFLLITGLSYSYASSLGELIALALNSRPPTVLKSASVAIVKSASWTRPTAVRETPGRQEDAVDRLELVADEDIGESVEKGSLHRRLVAGKRYQ